MKLVNNARSILKTDIVGGSSSFLIQDLEGDVFKYEIDGATTNEFTIFAEQIESGVITRREPIKVKRAGDVFTIIERKSQDCVGNDIASPKVREKKEYNFTAGITQISIYASEEDFDYINDELDLKLNTSIYDSEKVQVGTSTTGIDSYQAAISGITSYIAGQRYQIEVDVANTSAATLEINSLGPINIQIGEGGVLINIPDDTITAGTYAYFTYLSSGVFQYTSNEGNIVEAPVKSMQTNITYGEEITTDDITNNARALYVHTDGKAYKTDASDVNKINFSYFALEEGLVDTIHPVLTFGSDDNFTGLTPAILYYLLDKVIEQLAFDLSSPSFIGTAQLDPDIYNPGGIAISTDGTKIFATDPGNYKIGEWLLSTPFNITTSSFVKIQQLIESGGTDDLDFNLDGTKVWTITGGGYVRQFTLSTAWDISTYSYDSIELYVETQDTQMRGLNFSRDGLKMYTVGYTNDRIYEYTLSTAWDLSTATYNQYYAVGTQTTQPEGVFISNNGEKIFVSAGNNSFVYQYDLSTPYDISTASIGISYDTAKSAVNGLCFDEIGENMYTCSINGEEMHQWATGTYIAPQDAGLIGPTPGTNTKTVGKSILTTELLINPFG